MSIRNLNSAGLVSLMYLFLLANTLFAAPVITVDKLNITNTDLPGRAPESQITVVSGFDLFAFLGSFASQYLDKGCHSAGSQRLHGQDSTLAYCLVMDFVNDGKAKAMYTEKKIQYSGDIIKTTLFPDSSVFVKPIADGIIGNAFLKNIYFEITLSGFSDQQKALQSLNEILTFYQKKEYEITHPAIKFFPKAKTGFQNNLSDLIIAQDPISGKFHLSFSVNRKFIVGQNGSIKIYNGRGKLLGIFILANVPAGKNQITCNTIGDLASSFYFFRLTVGDESISTTIPYCR